VKRKGIDERLMRANRVDEDEIEERVDALRKKLLGEMKKDSGRDVRSLKPHQVHELAAAKLGMLL
jgi:cwf21 domain